jgi:ubiquinone/menaquinone biosynthesis C-methylase UbiE
MHRWLAQRLVDQLPLRPGIVVVDAAGGTGLAGRVIRNRLSSTAIVVVVDLSTGLLRAGRAAEPRMRPVRGDVARLPIATASADLIVCVAAVAYFENPSEVLAEFFRVLEPSGSLGFAAKTSHAGRKRIRRRSRIVTSGCELITLATARDGRLCR